MSSFFTFNQFDDAEFTILYILFLPIISKLMFDAWSEKTNISYLTVPKSLNVVVVVVELGT